MVTKSEFKQTEIGMIPEDWKFDYLINHLYIKGRIGWKGLQKSEYLKDGTGILIINGTQIQGNRMDWSKCERVPEWRYDESPEIQLKVNDIVMTKDGTIGKVAFVDYLPEKSSVASGIFVIRSISGKIDQKFLFHYFKSSVFKWLIETRKEGSVIPHLYQRDFEDFPIVFPKLKEQSAIAKILSDLDSKIELNQQMNRTLEAIGQAIFKRWFIDFEFPNEKGKPYKSSGGKMIESELGMIPEGWKVSTIGKELRTILGGTPSTEKKEYWENGTVSWINSGKVNEFRIIEPTAFITQEAVENSATKLMPKGTTVLAITGATLGQVSRLEIDACANQSVIGIIENKEIPSEYIYLWIKYKIIDLISHQTGGAQQHINKNNVNELRILLPDDPLMLKFKEVMSPIFKNISINCFESQNLSQIRDSLLPRLMSGKIRVPIEVRT